MMEDDFQKDEVPLVYRESNRRRSVSAVEEEAEITKITELLKTIAKVPRQNITGGIDLQSLAFALNSNLLGIKKKAARSGLKKFDDAFSAVDVVTWIKDQFDLDTREEATEIGNQLLLHDYIAPIKKEKVFRDNQSKYLFTETFHEKLDEHNKLQRETLVRYRNPSLLKFNYKWIQEKGRASYFQQFLVAEHADENLAFYDKIQKYKKTEDLKERKAMLKELYDLYVNQQSPSAVNLGGLIIEQIENELEKAPTDIFRDAEVEIDYLLSSECFMRFRKTKFFRDALEIYMIEFYEKFQSKGSAEDKKRRLTTSKNAKFMSKCTGNTKRKLSEKATAEDIKSELKNYIFLTDETSEDCSEEAPQERVSNQKRNNTTKDMVSNNNLPARKSAEEKNTKVIRRKSNTIIAPSFFTIRSEDQVAKLQLGLIEDYDEPQVMFYIEAEQFKAIAKEKEKRLKDKAKMIYEKYFAENAAYSLNLPTEIVSAIEVNYKEPTPTLFEKAKEFVSTKVFEDQYVKFLASDNFAEMLNTLWTSSENAMGNTAN